MYKWGTDQKDKKMLYGKSRQKAFFEISFDIYQGEVDIWDI